MSNYSRCGINCDTCKYKIENGCSGCKITESEECWGMCYIHKCCKTKNVNNCGECLLFPCDMIDKWAESKKFDWVDNFRKLMQ